MTFEFSSRQGDVRTVLAQADSAAEIYSKIFLAIRGDYTNKSYELTRHDLVDGETKSRVIGLKFRMTEITQKPCSGRGYSWNELVVTISRGDREMRKCMLQSEQTTVIDCFERA